MGERVDKVSLVADVSNYEAGMEKAGNSTTKLGTTAETTGEKTRGVISKIGGSLTSFGSQVGGELGEMLSTLGEGIEKVSEHSVKLSTGLQVGGGVAIAAGVALATLGSKETQASQQLQAAVKATGDSWEEYEGQIDAAIKRGENFDHDAIDTQTALRTLTAATGSTKTALSEMSVVTDLAAAKHETLADAASEVSRILNGSGARTLAAYGIVMDKTADKTTAGRDALEQLGEKLDGQAASSVNNFGSQVDIAKTKITDWVDEIAGPAGTALTTIGTIVGTVGSAMDIFSAIQERRAATELAAAAASTTDAAAIEAEGVAATVATPRLAALTAAAAGAGKGILAVATSTAGIATAGVALAYGIDQGLLAFDRSQSAAENYNISLKNLTATIAGVEKENDNLKTQTHSSGSGPTDALKLTDVSGGNFGFSGDATKSAGDIIGPLINGASGYTGAADGISKIDTALAKLVSSGHGADAAKQFDTYKSAADALNIPMSTLNSQFPEYTAALKTAGSATQDTANDTDTLATSAVAAGVTLDQLSTFISGFGKDSFSAADANRAFQAAIDDATDSLKKNGKTLDDHTAKGRANSSALEAIAQSGIASSAATLNLTQNTTKAADVMASARKHYIDAAEALGVSAAAAKKMADNAGLIPGLVSTSVKFNHSQASSDVEDYDAHLHNIPNRVSTSVSISGVRTVLSSIDLIKQGLQTLPKGRLSLAPTNAHGGLIDANGFGHFATGGYLVSGAGSGTSDSVPAWLSAGEYVNTAASVSKYGAAMFQAINRGSFSPNVYVRSEISPQRPVNQNITFVNPVAVDPAVSARRAGQILSTGLAVPQ